MKLKSTNLTSFIAILFLSRQTVGKIQKRETDDDRNFLEAINFIPREPVLPPALYDDRFHIINNMSISLQKKLNEIDSKEDFAKFFGILKPRIRKPQGLNSVSTEVETAKCSPILTPVTLPAPESPTATYFPFCVLLERCGGCCYGDALSCQPISTEDVKIKVTRIESTPDESSRTRRETTDTEVVLTEKKHLKCACLCAIQKKHCDPKTHVYDENECACKCTDRMGEAECLKNHKSHFWNSKKCSCFCWNVLECSSGETFDHKDCRCKKSPSGTLRTVSFGRTNV